MEQHLQYRSSSSSKAKNFTETNYELCALCQKEIDDDIMNPSERKGLNRASGYATLARNIPEFNKIGKMPLDLDIDRINDGSGIENTLQKNKAFYHKSCYKQFCNMKLERAQKQACKRKIEDIDTENSSPVKTRRILNSTPTSKKRLCFFCEECNGKEDFHEVQTFQVDKYVRECATVLGDRKLLTKLASCDMIAMEAVYHSDCYKNLISRKRSHDRKLEREKDQSNALSYDAIAFAELVAYIEDAHKNGQLSFPLATLTKMFAERLAELEQHEISSPYVHPTRLTERLLQHIPDLEAIRIDDKKGVKLMFSKDIGPVIHHALSENMDNDAIKLVRAAQVVRDEIFETKYEFSGSFEDDCERSAVPRSLLSLVQMIIEGPNMGNQNECNTEREHIAVAIAELLHFNTLKKSRTNDHIRHNKDREMPLPIYISMLIHAKTRNRSLIDTLFKLGLCVSYDRLLNISTQLANNVCAQYHHDDVVCPPQLSKNIFTCGAVDNIDHNPSAKTAHDSFHGTAISLMQFPTSEKNEEESVRAPIDVVKQSKISPLPQRYTLVPPVTATSDPVVPTKCGNLRVDQSIISTYFEKEREWLSNLASVVDKETLNEADNLSWAAYHASKQPEQNIIPSNIALLPLFRENAHTTCMISHAMQMVMDATNHINSSQIPVIVMDQPLYAICKQIQWTWPDTRGEHRIIAIMGGLHIEMNLLKLLGDWLHGSGWTTSIVQADIISAGRADAMLSASHVTRTRYAHQITAGSLKILQERAYKQYIDRETEGQNILTFEKWCDQQCQEQPQFKYWVLTLQLELMVLQFIRSIRERNFQMYVQSLIQIVPWLFALDHINYARWVPVHIADMVNLNQTHPEVYQEFMKGHFAVQKTNRVFSAMSIDQCHEQLNAFIKSEGGAVGLTENPQALERWLIAGPEISRLVLEYDDSFKSLKSKSLTRHHEQYLTVQKKFAKDVNSLVATIEEMGNPFIEDNGDLLTLDTKIIMSKEVKKTVYSIEAKGEEQYHDFVNSRLKSTPNIPLSNVITKNKLPLFSTGSAKQQSKTKQQMRSMKTNCTLFSRMYIACQSRQGNLDEFFRHENQKCPPSLSDMGQLRQGTKSDLLDCLKEYALATYDAPCVDAKVFDGAAIVHMLRPRNCRTFEEYAQNIFLQFIVNQLKNVDRVDVIWDRYFPNSLKQSTRVKRMQSGTSRRHRVVPNSPIPSNWESFLRIEENKDELFHLLSSTLHQYNADGKILVSTVDDLVISAGQNVIHDLEMLQPCTHEEADTRILLHVAHIAKQGYKRISIRTVDTDVVVLAVGHFQALGIEELWINFGVGKSNRYIAAHTIATALNDRAKALMMFHSLTGCDTVSSFHGYGKKSAWLAWMGYPEATNAFTSLLSQPSVISTDVLNVIQRFVILMYSKTSTHSSLNEARKALFAKGRTIENIPPTEAAFTEHLRRGVLQAGHIWSQALVPSPVIPDFKEWGWRSTSGCWEPYWTTLDDVEKSCQELVKCSCKGICKTCKCRRYDYPCTELCNCKGECNYSEDDCDD